MFKTFLSGSLYLAALIAIIYNTTSLAFDIRDIKSFVVDVRTTSIEQDNEIKDLQLELLKLKKDKYFINELEMIGSDWVCIEDKSIQMAEGDAFFGKMKDGQLKIYTL